MAVTPNYGWPVPVATDYVKDGWEAISDLGNAIDTTVAGLGAGLTLIKTQTIGTTVSSITVSDVFSATYDAYKVIIVGGASTTNDGFRVTFGATATGYDYAVIWGSTAGNVSSSGATSAAYALIGEYSPDSLRNNFDILNPYNTKFTFFGNAMGTYNLANGQVRMYSAVLRNTTSYTSFTLTCNTGTVTGGEILVYGYQK